MKHEEYEIVCKILQLKLENGGWQNFNFEKELKNCLSTLNVEINTHDREKLRAIIKEKIDFNKRKTIVILDPITVINDKDNHIEWYDSYLENNPDRYHWNRLERLTFNNLSKNFGSEKAAEILQSLDSDTDSIISLMEDPNRDIFNSKGLVVGYVQSGKTANFTALIAKAVDAGYKLIIILAGIHNVLRKQTQIRLDQELTGMDDLDLAASGKTFIEEPSDIKRWIRLTNAGPFDEGEFNYASKDPFNSLAKRKNPIIAVIKKNVTVLDSIITYFANSKDDAKDSMPLLLIDDEADQASVDGNANSKFTDPTATNSRIRILLELFKKKAYVGYTATPFANVLIDMNNMGGSIGNDLYPRNFIASLSEPKGYFGSKIIFQSQLSENFVKGIFNSSEEKICLLKKLEVTQSLEDAIYNFLIGCAIRDLRGDSLLPMSMLIHVSHLINDQKKVFELIDNYFNMSIIARLMDGYGYRPFIEDLNDKIENFIKDSKVINENLSTANIAEETISIRKKIEYILRNKKIKIIMLNSESEEKLEYSANAGKEFKVIAIGGNQLSRGLTLEGLMTSYYIRESKMYDTLLQMGRWFGYRNNYEDLTRIHTTEKLWSDFEHLSQVEEELRQDIQQYADNPDITPADVSVRIKDHSNLHVTSPNKLGAAKKVQASFSGSLCQTIWFSLDKPEVLRSNYNLGDRFIKKLKQNGSFINESGRIWLYDQTVDGKFILNEILDKYSFVSKTEIGGPSLDTNAMIDYIKRALNNDDGELSKWSVGVPTNKFSKQNDDNVTYGGLEINMVVRNRFRKVSKGYKVGVITDSQHLTSDLDKKSDYFGKKPYYISGRKPENPLLLLYLICKDSKVNIRAKRTIDLYDGIESEKVDVLGLAFVFPESKNEKYDYIGQ